MDLLELLWQWPAAMAVNIVLIWLLDKLAKKLAKKLAERKKRK